MYDKDGHFGRGVQFVCAVPLLLIGGTLLYISFAEDYSTYYELSGGIACAALGGRCLWYAVTGRDNVNKDLYD